MRVKDGKALAIVSDVLATLCAESFGGVVISLLRREGRAQLLTERLSNKRNHTTD
jgi:hypothetical protein